MAETLKQYLAVLGFRVDEGQQRKFNDALGTATKRAAGLGLAITGAAAATVVAGTRMARSLDDLYWMSRRTKMSAENITSFSFAVSQLGGNADAARASLKNVANFLLYNPIAGNFLRSWGIDEAKVRIGDFSQAAERLQEIFQGGPLGPVQARNVAEMMGLDEDTFRAIISGEFAEQQERVLRIYREHGFTAQSAAEAGKDFARQMDELKLRLGLVALEIGTKLMPQMKEFGGWMREVARDPEFKGQVREIAEGFVLLAKGAGAIGSAGAAVVDFLQKAHKETDGWSTKLLAVIAGLKVLGLLGPLTRAIPGAAVGGAVVGAAVRGALPLAAAGVGGYWAGSAFYDSLGADTQERLGETMARIMAPFSEEARDSLTRSGARGYRAERAQELFSNLEKVYGLPPGLLDAVWSAESGRGRHMVSPKGATGHFQFMPRTAKEFGLTPEQTMQLGPSAGAAAEKLSGLMKYYGGDVAKAVAAYNFGEGNLERTGLSGVPAETAAYMDKVLGSIGNGSPTINQTTSITVNAPGADGKEIADAVFGGQDRVNETLARNLRATVR